MFLFSHSCFRRRTLDQSPNGLVVFIGDETLVALPPLPETGKERVMLRRRFKNILSFPDRLEQEAKALKDQACDRPSKQRESLLREARQLETAAYINEWLTSPGLSPPK
jgi:hypothetical protein